MDVHKNARLAPKGREAMFRAVVGKGLIDAHAARLFHTTPKTVGKWVKRFRDEGVAGLQDRSSRLRSLPIQAPLVTCYAIDALRRERCTQDHIAIIVGVS